MYPAPYKIVETTRPINDFKDWIKEKVGKEIYYTKGGYNMVITEIVKIESKGSVNIAWVNAQKKR